ncbi:ribonuclease E activity regulator RraA [Corynebacterium ammoniagenes]|uniref:4-hydroxy-4-methyl-2-oxoglutarate aldolase n=2 Tax=Corynebacterium ammoniagenes TaxID=1697 RepID=A0AAV5G8U1_CORAM|nr:ribonuclease E activity regulator RraA [Corynebacterium ammoniagenes]APT82093.1 ribonuclease [Corynebacterium ammoniagenes DSM 20306]AQS73200.1 S-adenosylmethionine--2-demethylmenaquinone methyltransferase [Corynebacterium ammoniagenes]EFG80357.1 RraA family [Corynebacterium ammoniagenes DSM 20306]NMF31874.1 ribonuclease E activity regulator RraA [Corynebacterium ammoniagenes]GJN41911.1 4-hydroxy-4-methyl-2-oxoglutarate aldolase [Corynebacterium ammoniagenes]
MATFTSDTYDELGEKLDSLPLSFENLGGVEYFSGPAETVRVDEDNQLLKELMKQPGNGRVLVVDGGEKITCALMGGNMAAFFADSGWAGVVTVGAIRDRAEITEVELGVLAMGSNPKRSKKERTGEVGVKLEFAGVKVVPGAMVFADSDGVLIEKNSY